MAVWSIIFTPTTGSAVTLAGADACYDQPEAPEGIRWSNSDVVQTSAVIRASRPKRFARGNRLLTAVFSITRNHTDFAASMAAVATHIAAFSTLGTAVFTDGTTSITLYNADVKYEGGSQGAQSRFTYTITGTPTS